MGSDQLVEVDGQQVRLTNLDRVLYPEVGFTKGQVLHWYASVAPVLVEHLRGRPVTLKRYPNGVDEPFFFEKACPGHRPDWVPTVALPSTRHGQLVQCTVASAADVVWLANLASLELHPLLCRAPAIDEPDQVVFDLDPGAPAGWAEVTEVALVLRATFEALGLVCVVKSSGSKGLHVSVPLGPGHRFDQTKAFARQVAEVLARQRPDLVVSTMAKARRQGRVLVDWSQNDRKKTTITAWSLRAQPRPWVAVPLAWDEVEAAAASGDWSGYLVEPDAALARLARDGDLHDPSSLPGQDLPR